ncbi:Hypothetical predicted protein [Olea europaea subsp. europaea]|uniref:Uncharacterized protein n=1 Tax=Olea europaea subsp. europaea TaxID=158383 RepID=A0A8S0UG18_OLEEU|nr:Hypothetical predicted protein [Olea europaea subsp. europaea]
MSTTTTTTPQATIAAHPRTHRCCSSDRDAAANGSVDEQHRCDATVLSSIGRRRCSDARRPLFQQCGPELLLHPPSLTVLREKTWETKREKQLFHPSSSAILREKTRARRDRK